MAKILDPKISELTAVTALSSDDIFLVSQKHNSEGGGISYSSNKVTFNSAVRNVIDYQATQLADHFKEQMSSIITSIVSSAMVDDLISRIATIENRLSSTSFVSYEQPIYEENAGED